MGNQLHSFFPGLLPMGWESPQRAPVRYPKGQEGTLAQTFLPPHGTQRYGEVLSREQDLQSHYNKIHEKQK